VPTSSLRYRFRQGFRVSASKAYTWCTDFRPDDAQLFRERTRRTIRRLNDDALVLTDTTYTGRRRVRIRRLVRLNPPEMAWTNTHLDGPFQGSQYWYRIAADGPRTSHLEFVGLRLETHPRALPPSETSRRAEACRRSDADVWRRTFAPALEREMS